MRKIEKGREGKVVRLDFRRMVVSLAALFLAAGVAGVSTASDEMKKGAEVKVKQEATQAKEAVKDKVVKMVIPEYVDINTQKSCPDIKGLKKDIKHVNHFTHEAHIEMLKKEKKGFVCATCHKGAKSEADILKENKCKRLEQELNEAGGPAKLKDYFHSTCLKCHKDLKKEGKKTGPVSCKGCHGRKGGDK